MYFYLVAIPVAALLYHSINILTTKYLGKEPLWLKIYVMVSFFYIIATPVLFVNYLSQIFHLADSLNAALMSITGLILFILIINHSPSRKMKEKEN